MSARRIVRRAGPRRKLVWARTPISTTLTIAAGVTAPFREDLLANLKTTLASGLLGVTVVRMRGLMTMKSGGQTSLIRQGVKVVDESDFVGASIIEDGPISSPYNDWMMIESYVTGDVDTNASEATCRVFDVRSARKIDEVQQTLALYVQPTSGGAGTLGVVGDFSVLLMLP